MNQDHIEKIDTHEEALLRFRPAWRSFFVFFLGIAVCLGGPLLRKDSPLSLTAGILISAVFLIIIIRRWSHLYTLTNRRLMIDAGIFSKDTSELLLPDIASIEVNQGLTLRLMGAGHLLIRSRQPDRGPLVLFGLLNPVDFKARLERLAVEAREGSVATEE